MFITNNNQNPDSYLEEIRRPSPATRFKAKIVGERKQYHKVTLELNGPEAAEAQPPIRSRITA